MGYNRIYFWREREREIERGEFEMKKIRVNPSK